MGSDDIAHFLRIIIVVDADFHCEEAIDSREHEDYAGECQAKPGLWHFLSPKILPSGQSAPTEESDCGATHQVVVPMVEDQVRKDECCDEGCQEPEFWETIAGPQQGRCEEYDERQTAESCMQKAPAAFYPGAGAQAVMQVAKEPEDDLRAVRES